MAGPRQRRSGSTASNTNAPSKAGAGSVAESTGALAAPAAEILASPYTLLGVDNLVSYGITLAVSLVAHALFTTITAQLPIMGPVAQISRNMIGNWEYATLLGWRVAEISVGWFTGFNAFEMALFTLVSSFPLVYFLWTFYAVGLVPLILTLTLNTAANVMGFAYSRLDATDISALTGSGQDIVLWISTRLLSAALYAVPMLLSLGTWLPVHLATYWNDVETLAPARSANILGLAPIFFLLGHCTVGLILNPIVQHKIQVQGSAPRSEFEDFDPAAATLQETVEYNLNGLFVWRHVRPSVWFLMKRTAVLALWTTANAAFTACATVDGCDTSSAWWLQGPTYWGTVWGAGAIAGGVGMGWVGGIF